jgi:hypothetical protein
MLNGSCQRFPARSFQARRVHRTAIACPGQKVWHNKHIMQRLLFSGKTPSPFTLTKTPMEHKSTHLWWLWQYRDLLHRSGSTYTSIPTFVAGPTSMVIPFFRHERAQRDTAPGLPFLSVLQSFIINYSVFSASARTDICST